MPRALLRRTCALLTGAATLTLFLTHGLVFLTLKTTGALRARARRAAGIAGVVAAVVGLAALLWLNLLPSGGPRLWVVAMSALAVLALVFAMAMHRAGRDGWAFAGTAVTIGGVVLALFGSLYPRLLPSTLGAATDLTVTGASASHYSLTIMSWSALALIPLVIAYQAWTYWVFRQRVTVEPAGGSTSPTSQPVALFDFGTAT